MQEKSKLNGQRRTAIACSRTTESYGEKTQTLPPPPVMSEAWRSLRLLLSCQVADLGAITDVIRGDMGLMIELLRLPAMLETRQGTRELLDIKNLVVLAGIDQLQALAAQAAILPPEFENDARVQAFEHYSALAQRAAAIAERLALNEGSAPPECAYAAALVRNLSALPSILGWDVSELPPRTENHIGCVIAKSWGLPNVLIDVVRGDREACPAASRVLIDLADAANSQALAWEVE